MRASGTHASELEMRHENVKVSSMDRKLSKDVKLILKKRMQKNKGKEDTMASSMIHLAIVQEMRKKVSFRDINRLFLGVILPDILFYIACRNSAVAYPLIDACNT